MYWLDIVIIGIAVLSVIYGLSKGFVKEVFLILQILLPFLIALRMSIYGQRIVQTAIHDETFSSAAGFIGMLLVAGIVIWILGSLLSKTIHYVGLGKVDRVLGGIFGILKAGLISGIICIFILTFLPHGERYLRDSIFAPKALFLTHKAVSLLPTDLKEKFTENLRQLKTILKEQKLKSKPSQIPL